MEREEYPRPQLRRDDWLSLNGEWEFDFDDENSGEKRALPSGKVVLGKKIKVPFAYQYPASGIGDTEKHETVWYRRSFVLSKVRAKLGALLCFNGSDYITDVWINGSHALRHVGGCAPFSGDVSKYLKAGANNIVVRCVDPYDPTIPRGKQSWTGDRFACWYIPTTGIWQSVWLEFFGKDGLRSLTVTPNIDELSFSGEIVTLNGVADSAELKVSFGGKTVKTVRLSLDGKHTRYSVRLMENDFVDETTYWTPETPNLYYIDLTMFCGGDIIDTVHTRFGMREVSIDNAGNITLNHRKLYQRLILDQGYWKESGLTPPSADALKNDIVLAKAMGFNGARKHQKLEDPYFYYYADEIGFLCWCEMPSAYNFCLDEMSAITAEWQEIVSCARAFSSVICYVPLNESWGVRKIHSDACQQRFAAALYYLTKSLDASRLVSTNDGWENVSETDMITVHDYAKTGDDFLQRYVLSDLDGSYPQGRKLMAMGHSATGKPVLFTEFGGIAFAKDSVEGSWGYSSATDADEFEERVGDLMDGVRRCNFQGYCYTQLTDVQQEVNGLLDADHKPKIDVERLKQLFE